MSEHIVTLIQITCTSHGCGVIFGLEESYRKALMRSHKTFYCPNGHARCYPGKSDIELAREEAERQKANAEYWSRRTSSEIEATRAAQRRTLAYQGHLGKLKKRIANGVCPCCKRTFGNVARHIASQHPDYSAAEFVMPRPDEKPEPSSHKAKTGSKVTA